MMECIIVYHLKMDENRFVSVTALFRFAKEYMKCNSEPTVNLH